MVTVIENEDKGGHCYDIEYFLTPLMLSTVDPVIPNPSDRMTKLRSQQEVRII